MDDRRKVAREPEDIQLAAAAEKIARVQLETKGTNPDMQEVFGACGSSVGGAAEQIGTLRSDFELETARRRNEGEL